MTGEEIAADKTMIKTIHINAPASKVWSILTTPESMKLWMSDSEITILSDWKAGSPILFAGDLHGIPFENKGVIMQIEPEAVFQYTFWSSLSQHPDTPENYALITFRLIPAENGTTLKLTQSNFVTQTIYHHFNFYWTIALEVMKKLIESEQSVNT